MKSKFWPKSNKNRCFPLLLLLKTESWNNSVLKDKIPLVQNTQPGKEGSVDDGERRCYSPFPSKTSSLFIRALKWALPFPRYEVCWAGFGEKVAWGWRNLHPLQLIRFSLLYMVFELLEQQRGWGVLNLPLSPLRFPLQMRSMATSFLKWRHEPVDCPESSSLFYLVIFLSSFFFLIFQADLTDDYATHPTLCSRKYQTCIQRALPRVHIYSYCPQNWLREKNTLVLKDLMGSHFWIHINYLD